MLTKEFIPEICKPSQVKTKDENGNDVVTEVPAKYEGRVKIRVPDYDERQEFFLAPEFDEELNEAARAKREGASDAELKEKAAEKLNARKMMAVMRNIRKQLKDWVLEIEIKRLDDGFVFTSLDEVRYDTEVGAVCQEITSELLGKYRWGNPNTQQS